MPLGVVTLTVPDVAPAGTAVVISVSEMTENAAGVPLKLTPVDPVKLYPRIITLDPALPEVGCVAMKLPHTLGNFP